MAKISDLPTAALLDGEETLPLVQAGSTRQATLSQFITGCVPFLQDWYKGDTGETGPAENTYTTLASFKASDVTRKVASLVGIAGIPDGLYYFKTDNPPYVEDGLFVVKADSTALTVGAWVRQEFLGLSVKDFGAKGDGIADETARFQRAIDATPNSQNVVIVVPQPLSNYVISGILDPGLRQIQWQVASGGSVDLAKLPGAVSQSRKGVNVHLPHGAAGGGWTFEVTKTPTPLNYVASTRAAFVVQIADDQDLGFDELQPAEVSDIRYSGNGWVDAANGLSASIGMGKFVFVEKTGDGSGQAHTIIGELGVVGNGAIGTNTGGYNELGGYQGTLTNIGSTNGNMSGFEFILRDGPSSSTHFDTRMACVISRIARFHDGIQPVYNFVASSEGTQAPDAIFATNANSPSITWKAGFDLSRALFSSGFAMLLPNNTTIGWMGPDGVGRAIVGSSNVGITYLRPSGTAAYTEMQSTAGATLLRADNNNDSVSIFIGGALKRITMGANDSGGAGYSVLRVVNR